MISPTHGGDPLAIPRALADAGRQPFADAIPDVRRHVFPESSHMPNVEERDAFMTLLTGFLATVDER